MCQVAVSLSHWKMDSEIIGIYIKSWTKHLSVDLNALSECDSGIIQEVSYGYSIP